jgi:hypothetical protein
MSHNSEVDIDYESLPIGAGQYRGFFLPLSVSSYLLGSWCWWWRGLGRMLLGVVLARSRIRKKRPRNSSPGGRWASCSGLAILDLDLHLDLPQFDIHLAIILSSILRASKHVHAGIGLPQPKHNQRRKTDQAPITISSALSFIRFDARTYKMRDERRTPVLTGLKKDLTARAGRRKVDMACVTFHGPCTSCKSRTRDGSRTFEPREQVDPVDQEVRKIRYQPRGSSD